MKKGNCRGCDSITEREMITKYQEDGITPMDPPVKEMRPFCKNYQLHVVWVDTRIHLDDEPCMRYRSGGIT